MSSFSCKLVNLSQKYMIVLHRNCMTVLHRNYMLIFITRYQDVFQSGYAILHFHQQTVSDLKCADIEWEKM